MAHDSKLWAVTHSSSGLLLAYALVAVPMFVGLVRARAPWSTLVLWPLHALAVALIAGVVFAIMSLLLYWLGMAGGGLLQIILGAVTFVVFGYTNGTGLARERPPDGSYRRGAVVWDAEPTSRRRRSRRSRSGGQRAPDPRSPITLAGMRVAAVDEAKHFKFIGTTGTGKSTAIREMLSVALARGDRAGLADPDAGHLVHCYE